MNGERRKLKGFSLGEVMLSVAVLAVGVLPVLSAMTGGFRSSLQSRDIVVASGLAQEGTELVKNVKDNNVLAGSASLTAWLPASGGPEWDNCRIDTKDAALSPGTRITCGSVSFKLALQSDNLLRHAAGSGRFNRKILLSYDSSNERVTCISAVYWGASYVPSTVANARTNCNVNNSCVYAESVLSPWAE